MPQERVAMRKIREMLRLACQQELFIKGVSYKSIKSILENNLDQNPLPNHQELSLVSHDQIRGTDYHQ